MTKSVILKNTLPAFSVAALVVATFGTAIGCSLLVDDQRSQCSVDKDCVSRGDAFANTTCVAGICEGEEEEKVEQKTCDDEDDCDEFQLCIKDVCEEQFECSETLPDESANSIPITVPIRDVAGNVLPDIPTRLCRILDPECSQPVMNLTSNNKGFLEFELPPGFNGYLEFNVPNLFPQLEFLPPNPQPNEELEGIALSPNVVIQGLAAAVGAQADPERGHLLLEVNNCFGFVAGVSIDSAHEDSESIPYYVLDGVPAADLTETTESGSGGFLNFRPGNAVVKLKHIESGEEVGQLSVIVRAGHITSTTFQPSRMP